MNRITTVPFAASLLAALFALAAPQPAAAADTDSLHAPFDRLLAAHVKGGVVDYAGFAADGAKLDAYLSALARTDPGKLAREAKLAFWINAYNAFTVKLILNHYPGLESIRDIPRGERWKWEGWTVNGETISLDKIEHEVLRPMGDPRVHFAVNCASFSCPLLAAQAYTAAKVDSQLDAATARFLADEERGMRFGDEKGRFGGVEHVVYLSEIFHWFEGDFRDAAGSRIDFIIPHSTGKAREYLEKNRYDLNIEKLNYNWSLNGS